MADDWQSGPPETDGSIHPDVDPYGPTQAGLPAVDPRSQPPARQRSQLPVLHDSPPPALDHVEEGKTFALVSHASILLGVPLFIIPMLQRDNDFALHHAKAAAVNFGFLIFAIIATTLTCGLFFPLIFLVYVPAIVGAVRAANGELAGKWGWGDAGEKLFPKLRAEQRKQLEDDR